jgi:hypothetical protein
MQQQLQTPISISATATSNSILGSFAFYIKQPEKQGAMPIEKSNSNSYFVFRIRILNSDICNLQTANCKLQIQFQIISQLPGAKVGYI